ncbi:putative spermidine/putrescine transport system substrate-binding protein [Aminobacter aminovorans]|uniref:Solute-binding component of ABC transporter n=1 Tax=Aminobacter aminovorans TaxID=83263 RepID=A0AAC8YQX1_AMIAI|nr:ABC transporter substrate-binding protein [Aminobacter aminovorans]AMS42484.1 Putative solute-binding component of ABC transporter [Aminobacter aminovorans]MBB3707793.1 putative spermidine/putrescine transport system substrate-binding protein [Aminobacter aminovorans]
MKHGSTDGYATRVEPAAGQRPISRRDALKAAGLAGAALSTGAVSVCDALASADAMEDLVAAARAEGQLTVMALPRDWGGYGVVIDRFKAKYGLTINEFQPHASSARQIEAIKTRRGKTVPRTPDVVDLGMSFASSAKGEGLLQPYKASTWDTIPETAKDSQGYWCGGYHGVLAFEVNADLVTKMPRDWADLAAPEYRNSVAIAGNISSNQAVQSVFAAGLSAAKGNVEEAADQGLKFFGDLHEKGNFVPIVGDANSLADGRTPILIRWDYLALGDRDRLKGSTKIEVIRPKTGVVAAVYVQAISADAPHPNAAKLWMEYLYSDEAQLAWLKGHCFPIRIADLVRNGTVPIDWRERLGHLDHDGYDVDPLFPSLKDQEKAKDIITNGWDDIVGVKIQCLPPEDYLGPMSFNNMAHG